MHRILIRFIWNLTEMLKTTLTSKMFLVFSCQFALDLITAWVSSSESLGIIFFTAASILCIGPKLDRASGEYASRVRKAVQIQVHSITHSLYVVSLSQSTDIFTLRKRVIRTKLNVWRMYLRQCCGNQCRAGSDQIVLQVGLLGATVRSLGDRRGIAPQIVV